MSNLSAKQIKSVSVEGLVYTDNADKEQFIDFEACFATYVAKLKGIKAAREVGHINYMGEIYIEDINGQVKTTFGSPYVIFHDDTGTSFEFGSQEECKQFHLRFQSLGWSLFDLSD